MGYELEEDGLLYFFGYYFLTYGVWTVYFAVTVDVFVKEKFLNWSNPSLLFAITTTGVPIEIGVEFDDILAIYPFYWT